MAARPYRSRVGEESLEDAIAQVKGVLACQVVLDASGEVQEIHAVGTTQRTAKQIVRDIESLLRVSFGCPIDYRRVSLVQLDDSRARLVSARLELKAVVANVASGVCEVGVELEQQGVKLVGSSLGGCSLPDVLRTSALATLCAVAQYANAEGLLRLEDVRIITLASSEAVAVAAIASFPAGDEHLAGLSLVRPRGGPAEGVAIEAAARATLSALNRRLLLLRAVRLQ